MSGIYFFSEINISYSNKFELSCSFFTNTLILPEVNGPTEGLMLIYLCHFFTAIVGSALNNLLIILLKFKKL